jgi:hypothetical protein
MFARFKGAASRDASHRFREFMHHGPGKGPRHHDLPPGLPRHEQAGDVA